MDGIFAALRSWIHRKFAETFTDVGGNTAIRVTGTLVDITAKDEPTVINVPAPIAGTEYNVVIPADTAQYQVNVRGIAKVQYSFISGESGTNFLTINPGNKLIESGIVRTSDLTIYFQTTKPNETLEVLVWSNP